VNAPPPRLARIVSGGQTGVDRAALDVALALGIPCGGWVPRGRRAEDGPLPEHYPMREAQGRTYGERTRLNVRDSCGTLILARGEPTGGTALTLACARRLGRPVMRVDLADAPDPAAVRAWIARHRIAILNVAGPRESTAPGISVQARAFLDRLFADCAAE
jgi:putative molybdenum carrier protein